MSFAGEASCHTSRGLPGCPTPLFCPAILLIYFGGFLSFVFIFCLGGEVNKNELSVFLRNLGLKCEFLALHYVDHNYVLVTCSSATTDFRRLITSYQDLTLDVLVTDINIMKADLTSKFLSGFIGNRFFLPTKIIIDQYNLKPLIDDYVKLSIESLAKTLIKVFNDLIPSVSIPAEFFGNYYVKSLIKFLSIRIDEAKLESKLKEYMCNLLTELKPVILVKDKECEFKIARTKKESKSRGELLSSLIKAYETLQALPAFIDLFRDFRDYFLAYRDTNLRNNLILLKVNGIKLISEIDLYLRTELGDTYTCSSEAFTANAKICKNKEKKLVIKDYTAPISIKWWLVSALTWDIVKIYLRPIKRLSNELKYSKKLKHYVRTPNYMALLINPPIKIMGIREYIEGQILDKIRDENLWSLLGKNVAALHSKNIALIDTKPSNFIITDSNEVGFIDLEQCRGDSGVKLKSWDIALFVNYALFSGIKEELIKAFLVDYLKNYPKGNEIIKKSLTLEISKPFTILLPTISIKSKKLIQDVLLGK